VTVMLHLSNHSIVSQALGFLYDRLRLTTMMVVWQDKLLVLYIGYGHDKA
jgi:hypothetical protein